MARILYIYILFVFIPICVAKSSCFINVICIYVHSCPTQFTYKMVFVLLNSKAMSTANGAGNAYHPEHTS